jgi:Xaa-Pro dipeptidase
LRAAAGAAILEGGGDIDFLIIGTTSMQNPAMVFGNPRPSGRRLTKGDIINMELAAGYRGYTAQIGSPICLGEPTDMVKRFWYDITLPSFRAMAAEIKPGNPVETIHEVGKFFRQNGVQSRPIHAHGIDLITEGPHVFTDGVHGEAFERVFRPAMVFMAEPNPITADGNFGIFLGHTFIVTQTGHECVDAFPWELVVV